MDKRHKVLWDDAHRQDEENKRLEAQRQASIRTYLPKQPKNKKRKLSDGGASNGNQPTISESMSNHYKYTEGDRRNRKISVNLVISLLKDKLPISFVDSWVMQEWGAAICPKFLVPSRHIVTNIILPRIYSAARTVVIAMLKDAAFVSFDTDIWTSGGQKQYISLIGHCTFQNFSQEFIVLHSQEFKDSHTGIAINDMINDMVKNWYIPKYKLHTIVHDNAANVTNAMNHSELGNVPCFIHTSQLIIKDCIMKQKSVQALYLRCKRLVTHLNHSSQIAELLKTIQKRHGQSVVKVAKPVSTRWDSTIFMFERLKEMKVSLMLLFCHDKFKKLIKGKKFKAITLKQWNLMNKLVGLFTMFRQETKLFQTSYRTAAEIIPEIYSVLYIINNVKVKQQVSTLGQTLTAMKASCMQRYRPYLENVYCYLATFLDPRFKLTTFIGGIIGAFIRQHTKENIIEQLTNAHLKYTEEKAEHDVEVQNLLETQNAMDGNAPIRQEPTDESESEGQSPVTTPATETRNAPEDLLAEGFSNISLRRRLFRNNPNTLIVESDVLESNALTRYNITNEVNMYLRQPPLEETQNPFDWWQLHKDKYPFLSVLAAKYLSSPATSVDSERLFSVGGHIVNDYRTKLTAENTELLMFLAVNLPRIKDIEVDLNW